MALARSPVNRLPTLYCVDDVVSRLVGYVAYNYEVDGFLLIYFTPLQVLQFFEGQGRDFFRARWVKNNPDAQITHAITCLYLDTK